MPAVFMLLDVPLKVEAQAPFPRARRTLSLLLFSLKRPTLCSKEHVIHAIKTPLFVKLLSVLGDVDSVAIRSAYLCEGRGRFTCGN